MEKIVSLANIRLEKHLRSRNASSIPEKHFLHCEGFVSQQAFVSAAKISGLKFIKRVALQAFYVSSA